MEIVFATGYNSMRETTRKDLGCRIRTSVGGGVGASYSKEGELKSVWRRLAYPGFWFAGGKLALCTYYFGMRARQIKVIKEDMDAFYRSV